MRCCNAATLSKVVAGLTIALCIAAGMLDIVFLQRLKDGNPNATIKEIGLPYGILIMIVSITGLITSMLFIAGLQQNSPGKMAPFVFFSACWILIAVISTICIYCADLVTSETYFHAFLAFFFKFVVVGLQILFCSPIFVIYQRMRKTFIHPA